MAIFSTIQNYEKICVLITKLKSIRYMLWHTQANIHTHIHTRAYEIVVPFTPIPLTALISFFTAFSFVFVFFLHFNYFTMNWRAGTFVAGRREKKVKNWSKSFIEHFQNKSSINRKKLQNNTVAHLHTQTHVPMTIYDNLEWQMARCIV